MKQMRSIQVIKDLDDKNIVIINDIIFKGKKHINWKDVEEYLKRYIGEFYEIAETKDIVYIGKDFPKEFSHSKYTRSLVKSSAKTKANIITAIPELVEVANNKSYKANKEKRHYRDAKTGWYRFYTRFALPSYDNLGNINSYKIYKAMLIVRSNGDGKLFLYDVIQILKD